MRVFSKIVFTLLLFLSVHVINAQKDTVSAYSAPSHLAEKVYLQLDGKVYTKGNVIWFKSIVLSAGNHFPSTLSRILYVELVNSDETIMERKLIKLDNGIGQGFFELFESYAPGTYLIRAYTSWNKNFGPDFFFKEYIQVFANNQRIQRRPINSVKFIKEDAEAYRLTAGFNPLEMDSLHQGKLKVSITLDNKVDSLFLKKTKDDEYLLDYTFSGDSRLVRLQMQTENNKAYASTIILDQDLIDLQFLPESGELVHGLTSKVGFKVLDARGKGKMLAGEIIDEQENLITPFKSNELGMGSFIIQNADSTKKYYARIKAEAPELKTLLYPLPKVTPVGNVLSIKKNGDNLLIRAKSNYLKNDSIYLTLSQGGKRLYDLKFELPENGTFNFELACQKLPDGIISFTMLDSKGRPLAERVYFNENPASRIKINLAVDKESYEKRDLTELTIETVDQTNSPIPAHLSVLVVSKKQLGKIQQQRQNILSYFLLDSELKGEIENPGFYFNKDSSMHDHLDALMLTQGWRNYNYNKQDVIYTHLPETNLTVSGQVSGLFSEKRKKQAELTLTTFGNNPTVDVQIADSLGNFTFNLKDEYGQQVNVLIQSAKASGKKMNYNIALNDKESPKANFDLKNTIVEPDSLVDDFIRKELQRKKIEQSFEVQEGNILLDEIEFTGTRLTENQQEVREEYGEPDVVIDGKAIQEKEQNWSYGLYSVLRQHFLDKIIIDHHPGGLLSARITGSDITLVVVDGIPVKSHDYQMIPYIPPTEVKSFEVIECAKNFDKLFLETYGKPLMWPILCGGVVAIYTYSEKGIHGTKKPVGLLHTSIPVFSTPRDFYAPRYDKPNLINKLPDLRTLLHWEPELLTNASGKTSTSFFNGDNVGEMMIVVEAVSGDGSIGYQELEYVVEGQETVIVEF
ncbi:MAG: hypothetical protein RLQ12_04690 [Cyclobacteriaceae bacterium]